MPPHDAAVVTDRVRVCTPLPHVTEQALQLDQLLCTQFCDMNGGQSSSAYSPLHVGAPHCGCVWIRRSRDLLPPPHGLHVVHCVHSAITHGIGQHCVLHAIDSNSKAEPQSPERTVRARDWVPPPHVALHVDHSDHNDNVHAQVKVHDSDSTSGHTVLAGVHGDNVRVRERLPMLL